jgi:cyclophilin family peptidyl-prolyl cis-trans isomerase
MPKFKLPMLLLLFSLMINGCSFTPADPNVQPSSNFYDPSKLTVTEPPVKTEPLTKPKINSMENLDPNKFENLVSQYTGAVIKTNFGDIKVVFYGKESPFTVNNFMNLAKAGFYDQTKFHRVIKDFMIQGGDPNSKDNDWSNDGSGGPDYRFADEFNDKKLVKGSLAMANSGIDTNGSQFFIVTAAATSWLDGKHTNFGYVAEGMDVVAKIETLPKNAKDHPTTDAIIENIELIK